MEVLPALELILSSVNSITFLAPAAVLVVALTSLSKRFVPGVSASVQALSWQVAVWVVWTILVEYGFDVEQFGETSTAIATIITMIAGGVTSQAVATPWFYNKAVSHNAPTLSYRRTDPRDRAYKEAA